MIGTQMSKVAPIGITYHHILLKPNNRLCLYTMYAWTSADTVISVMATPVATPLITPPADDPGVVNNPSALTENEHNETPTTSPMNRFLVAFNINVSALDSLSSFVLKGISALFSPTPGRICTGNGCVGVSYRLRNIKSFYVS